MRIPFVGIIGLAVRRLRNRMALTVLSLLGVALAVGLVSSVPVFAQAVSFLVLRSELAETSASMNRPPLLMRFYYDRRTHPFTLDMAQDMEQRFAALISDKTGFTPAQRMMLVESPLPRTARNTWSETSGSCFAASR